MRINWKGLIGVLFLVIIIYIGSILLHPEWTTDFRALIILLVVAAGFVITNFTSIKDFFQFLFQPRHQAAYDTTRPYTLFVGRQDALKRLEIAARKKGAILFLHGTGGVGKSFLAQQLVSRVKKRYPDQALTIDLKGTDPKNPLSPADVMEIVIRAYQPLEKRPDTLDELKARYCAVLKDQKVIILLDDARDADQISPLVPPESCLLIITSRNYFILPGYQWTEEPVDPLPPKEAIELILKIAPRVGDQANVIAGLCGRLPLALRTSASILVTEANLTPDDLIRRLQDAGQILKLTGVEASLHVSYDLLDDGLKEKWRLLAVFPGSFDLQAAAAVWQVELDPAQDVLGQLLARSLVEYDPANQRYHLHELARLFVQHHCQPDELYQAQKRFSIFYKDVLEAAEKLYLQFGENVLAGLALFDLEWDNIQSGQRWAAEQADKDQQAGQLCSDYAGQGNYCRSLRLHSRQQIDWLQSGLAAARRLGDRNNEGAALGNLALTYARLGEPHRAIAYHEQALQIFREIGDRLGEGAALGNLGLAYADLGEPRRAIENYEQALQIERETGNRHGEGSVLTNLGSAYLDLGEPRRAIAYHEQALQILREIGDRLDEGKALGTLGLAYARLGEPRRAIAYYEQALQIDHEIGDRRDKGVVFDNLALAYASMDELHNAIHYLEMSIDIFHQLGDRNHESGASWDLGHTYLKLGNLAKSVEQMKIRLEYEREIGHLDYEKHKQEVTEVEKRIC
ncbi:MAG TPA: tetratricopeptide repeat protein [Anaerolineaceae bacterium]|nr:tetratricopeptide repeat protein [Anaerolineaceae bacterium]